jgi:dihydrolipoamide dehydrogenase
MPEIEIRQFDVAVLGGGPGGYAAAIRSALRGAKVCCIEAGVFGGTCLNVGCIPTKAMLHASELAWQMRRCGQFGLNCGEVAVDGPAFMGRVAKTVGLLVRGLESLLKTRKVEMIRGYGRLIGPGKISISAGPGGKTQPVGGIVKARSIILATGSRPARPRMFPWDSPRVFTTDEATKAGVLPSSIIIVGGGVIGCEFATIYSELGIKTTLVEMLDRLAANMDAEVSKAITRSLTQRGVDVLTGKKIAAMTAGPSGAAAQLESGELLEAGAALIAVGRLPNIEGIGLDSAGLAVADGVVKVDDRCRTNVEGIYAVGDMACRMQYAHLAMRMGIVAADNATGNPAGDDLTVVPMGLYTHPQVASVGLGESAATAKCPAVKIARFSYRALGMAQAYGEIDGMVKLMGDPAGGGILGGLVIGPHATDVIQEISLAMRCGLTIEQIARTIHPHPTFTEAIGEAAQSWLGLPLHGLT